MRFYNLISANIFVAIYYWPVRNLSCFEFRCDLNKRFFDISQAESVVKENSALHIYLSKSYKIPDF
ncbi:hypothetical protein GKR41_00271 [Candidatus Vallotia lariciata]|nr:hypothetical protein GKR41_00271 [Candidatus Vallotia lariciata]